MAPTKCCCQRGPQQGFFLHSIYRAIFCSETSHVRSTVIVHLLLWFLSPHRLAQGLPIFLFIGTLEQIMDSLVYHPQNWWRPKKRSLRAQSPVFPPKIGKDQKKSLHVQRVLFFRYKHNPMYPLEKSKCPPLGVHISHLGNPWTLANRGSAGPLLQQLHFYRLAANCKWYISDTFIT